MDAVASPSGLALDPSYVSLAALPPGTRGCVVGVGSGTTAPLSALERRLLEFGFIHGEQVEVLAEARPGRDPFVVRVGHTTLALRRREAQHVLIELHRQDACALTHARGAAPMLEASRAGS
jgi:ferrous iron transport protein A